MFDPFQSPRLLLARVSKHIQEFDEIERGFLKSKPYFLFEEKKLSGKILWKARITMPFPPELSAISFDIANGLRSALDHAVYDASKILGGAPKPKSTKFPIGNAQSSASKNLERHKSEVPQALWPYLLSCSPEPGGKYQLAELNELRNGNIHRTLEAVAVQTATKFLGGYIDQATFTTLNEWDSMKRELTYMKVGAGARYQLSVDIDAVVAFAPDTPFAGSRAVKTFSRLAENCTEIVSGLEAETAKLSSKE